MPGEAITLSLRDCSWCLANGRRCRRAVGRVTTGRITRVSSFVVGIRSGYQPKHRTGHDCLAVQGERIAPHPVWTFAQNTAPALAGLLLEPHSQSEGLAAYGSEARTTPQILRTFPDY